MCNLPSPETEVSKLFLGNWGSILKLQRRTCSPCQAGRITSSPPLPFWELTTIPYLLVGTLELMMTFPACGSQVAYVASCFPDIQYLMYIYIYNHIIDSRLVCDGMWSFPGRKYINRLLHSRCPFPWAPHLSKPRNPGSVQRAWWLIDIQHPGNKCCFGIKVVSCWILFYIVLGWLYVETISCFCSRDFVKNVTYDNRCRWIEKVPCILVASVSREMLLLLAEVPVSVVDTPTKNTNMEVNKSWL